jgi:two-component system, cell cycle sensor histidine kinase and response regulator CckA
MDPGDEQTLRQLLDDYLWMYASRDEGLTARFSEDFSGFTGGGDALIKDRDTWVAITRQDFAQVKDPIRIELKDVALQSLSETVAVATSFFTIHLPIKDHVLSRETARLVLIFHKESGDWKISHSSISIPYYLVREGEIYPLKELVERNQALEAMVAERTAALDARNLDLTLALDQVRTLRGLVPICSACKKIRDDAGFWHQVETYVHDHTEAEFSHGLCPDCLPTFFPKQPVH